MSGESVFESPAADRVAQKAAERGMEVGTYLATVTREAREITVSRGTLPGLRVSPNGSHPAPEAPSTPVVADEIILQAGGSLALGPIESPKV